LTRPLSGKSAALPLLLLLAPAPALATELVWDGSFRSRARFFDSLSLSNTNDYAEGASFAIDNRLRLQPGWYLSDHVSIHTQVDLLPFVNWGDQATSTDPVTGDDVALAWSQSVGPPTTSEDGATLQNIQVTRAWGEVDSDIGRFRFGRVPVQWGSGMVWNAGTEPNSEYGDTSDRVQITSKAGPVYLIGAYELPFSGYVNQGDDLSGVVGGVLYETESLGLGTYDTFRWSNDPADDSKFSAFIGDVWAYSRFGDAEFELEFAAIVGGGALDTGENDITVSSFGGSLSAKLPVGRYHFGLDAGFAGGDKDPTDSKLHTFSYDPDWNRTLMLFEEPLPTLEASTATTSNGGRRYDAIQSSDGISNALFLRPSAGIMIKDKLSLDLSLFAANRARMTTDQTDAGAKGYGLEVDLDAHYTPFDFFALDATAGALVPGKAFKEYDDDTLGDGFDQPAFGVRVLGTAHF